MVLVPSHVGSSCRSGLAQPDREIDKMKDASVPDSRPLMIRFPAAARGNRDTLIKILCVLAKRLMNNDPQSGFSRLRSIYPPAARADGIFASPGWIELAILLAQYLCKRVINKMSIFDLIERLAFNATLSLHTRKALRPGTSDLPARATRQIPLKAGILPAVIIGLAVLCASNSNGFSAAPKQGVAGVSVTSVSFGTVAINTTSAAHNVTLTNTGGASLYITGVAIGGTYASRFGQSNNCGSSLAPGANCSVSLTFTPNTTGLRSATLNISTGSWGARKSVNLNGTGVAATAPTGGVSPGSLSFGNQPVGTAGAAQTATLSNTGTAALSISGVTVTGSNPGDFAQSNSCGSSLPAGSSCTISVAFSPTASGSRTAAVSIADNASGSPQTISLSGTGVVAAATFSPASLSFGNQSLNTTSGALTATLTNSSGAALSITSIQLTGNYPNQYIQTNNCGTSVAVGASCTFSVQFAPINSGSITAAVTVIDNASNSPQSVSLSGTGTTATVSLSPSSLSFGNQSVSTKSGTLTATLTNGGSAALSLSSVALTGANAGDFAQSNTCGSSVAAGGSCTISVTFDPTASGSRTASVSITDNATGSPQSLSLSGTGTTATVNLSPSSLSFGNQSLSTTSGTLTATLTNNGSAALSLSSVALTGANAGDFAQSNTCGSSVAAGGSCTISVTFDPTASGSRTASVSITDNATGSPQSLGLSGTGTTATVSLSPASLSFGSDPIANTSSTQTVTLTNNGNAALTISSLTITGANAADFTEVANTCGSSVAAGADCTIAVAFAPSTCNSETASLTVADNVTGSPQTVSLSGSGLHNVNLSWTASSGSGIVGYNIYRGTNSGGESSTPLNSAPVNGTAFTDESVSAGSTYYYVVTAVGPDDSQSSASGETATTVPSN